MFNVKNKDTRTMPMLFFEHIAHIVPVSLLLALNRQLFLEIWSELPQVFFTHFCQFKQITWFQHKWNVLTFLIITY